MTPTLDNDPQDDPWPHDLQRRYEWIFEDLLLSGELTDDEAVGQAAKILREANRQFTEKMMEGL